MGKIVSAVFGWVLHLRILKSDGLDSNYIIEVFDDIFAIAKQSDETFEQKDRHLIIEGL